MNRNRFYEAAAGGAKRSAPAALRNREPVAQVLADWLPESGQVLEIASGSGEHAVYFAEKFPDLRWQPSDMHADALASIAAWRVEADLENLMPPLLIDASAQDWPINAADALLSLNMAHISPWDASLGLIEGAARLLPGDGPLILYGPWLSDSIDTAPSNIVFDQDLRQRNPAWGLRKVEDFVKAAKRRGLSHVDTKQMPANNLMLLFRRQGKS